MKNRFVGLNTIFMIIFESIKLALKSIWAHKIRSFLTMLGIIIGISSVVILVSIGEGVKNDVRKLVGDLGSNMIFVIGGDLGIGSNASTSQSQGGIKSAFGNPANLIANNIFTIDDINAIEKVSGVRNVTPVSVISGLISYGDKTTSPIISSAKPSIQDILTGVKLDKGRYFTDQEETDHKSVIIIGDTVRSTLFGDVDPIGKKIKISSQKKDYEFEIIGTFAKPTTSTSFSGDYNTFTLIPYSTGKILFNDNKDNIMRIGIRAEDNTDPKVVSKAIANDLLTRHKKEEFTVMSQDDMLGMLDTVMNMLTAFVSAIAAISLVVGGVGIMNIMLVSVTERTREIGIRKAVGATNGAILLQFLIEAVFVSIVGGIISLGLVRIATEIIEHYTELSPAITSSSIIISMGVCIGIGIIFGLAPAIQASRKDPIEALRYE